MQLDDIKQLILDWGVKRDINQINQDQMETNISLLGLDSIDFVEFCEYIEEKTGIDLDIEWVLESSSFNHLAQRLEGELAVA